MLLAFTKAIEKNNFKIAIELSGKTLEYIFYR